MLFTERSSHMHKDPFMCSALRLLDPHFGLNDRRLILTPTTAFTLHHPQNLHSTNSTSNNSFEVKFDVQQFTTEELSVKIINDCVVVEGKHEEKPDEQGYISRHFVRRYSLPAGVKPEHVTCSHSSDGMLIVSAPRIVEKKNTNEITIPIIQTGRPSSVTTSISIQNDADNTEISDF